METTVEGEIFTLFSKPIRAAIESKGFLSATEPQIRAIPEILKGSNILLVAPTGTGKTEAAFLPILDMLYRMAERPRGIKVLYVTPLRALNRDLLDRLEWWCKRLDFRLAVRHGDTEVGERGRQALVPPDILITTPETLQAILPGRIMRSHLKAVKWVIVDEVHELAEVKRGSQFSIALERLRYVTESDFQIIGLSATIGTPRKVAEFLVGEGSCEVVSVPVARSTELKVIYPKAERDDYELATRLYTFPDVAARLRAMDRFIQGCRSVLLFTNTRTEAEILANRFRIWDSDYPLGVHHGSLSRPSRISAERALKEGKIEGIICTSSLELGIDIGHLDLVIQYNSPRQVTRILQRVGRSGHRIGGVAKGVVVTQDSEDTLEAAVIARRALIEELEPVDIPDAPLDALAHQIAGLLLEKPRWSIQEALKVVRRAYPYRDLSEDDFRLVLRYMHERRPRLAWVSFEDGFFMKPRDRAALYNYYFTNLSMIPDEKQYLVLKEDGSPVGVLDEAFVAEYGEIGTKFVEGGAVWKVKQIYRDKIYVEAEDNPLGAIPTWVGDEIPVPFEVASEVGLILRLVEEKFKVGVSVEDVAEELSEKYPIDIEDLKRALREVEEQFKRGQPTPTDRRLTVEGWEEYIIVQCPAGHLVNRTLARVLGYLLTMETGSSVGVQQDPYRVVLKGRGVSPKRVESILRGLPKEGLDSIAVEAVLKTGVFKRRFLHVAKKFGVVSKDADLSRVDLDNLIDSLRDTAVFKEAVKTTLRDDGDLEGLKRLAERITSGEVEVAQLSDLDEPTPIARIGLEEISRKTDIIPPERMRQILLRSTQARLLNEARTVVCTECWDYVEVRKISTLQRVSCPECGSLKIGLTSESEEAVMRLCEKVKTHGEKVPKRYRRILKNATGSAELYLKYGHPAAVVLAGRSIRVSDAAEILKHELRFDDRLIELILMAESKALKRRYFI